jgi:N-sulfoglucosamine sulfohydrolase
MSNDSIFNALSRRGFLKGAAAVAASPQVSTSKQGKLPNIVYIHSHDSGRYLRQYGYNVPTPRLYMLARRGVLFRQVHSAAPTCSPSRAALLTGQSPHSAGMLGLAHLGWKLNDYRQHILHTLRPHGYRSVLAGLQHIAVDPSVIGFDEVLHPATTKAQDVTPGAVRWLAARQDEPFFMDVGFFETHRKFSAPVDDPAFIQPPAPIPDNAQTREDMAGFHASVRQLDKGVGEVLDALDKYGLAENTLVISTTDHGISFPHMKCNLRDAGTGVSLVMRGPGVFSKPQCVDALLSHIDVFPTICDYLRIEKPTWLQGKSFLPVIEGQQKEIREQLFAEVTYHASYEPKRAVRTHRWKYARRFDGRHFDVMPNTDDGLSKSFWLENGWKEEPLVQPEELYDLVFDPQENRNLVGDPAHAEVLKDMQARLERWMKETNDPLLKGPVPLPPGGHAVPPDALSPKDRGTMQ